MFATKPPKSREYGQPIYAGAWLDDEPRSSPVGVGRSRAGFPIRCDRGAGGSTDGRRGSTCLGEPEAWTHTDERAATTRSASESSTSCARSGGRWGCFARDANARGRRRRASGFERGVHVGVVERGDVGDRTERGFGIAGEVSVTPDEEREVLPVAAGGQAGARFGGGEVNFIVAVVGGGARRAQKGR